MKPKTISKAILNGLKTVTDNRVEIVESIYEHVVAYADERFCEFESEFSGQETGELWEKLFGKASRPKRKQ